MTKTLQPQTKVQQILLLKNNAWVNKPLKIINIELIFLLPKAWHNVWISTCPSVIFCLVKPREPARVPPKTVFLDSPPWSLSTIFQII